MLGVMRETLEDEDASMRGEDDFFSVARTIPFVAAVYSSNDCPQNDLIELSYL